MIRPYVLVSIFLLACQSLETSAEELSCMDGAIVFQGVKLEDLEDGCEAARSAARIFESSGLSMPRNVIIAIADTPPADTDRLENL